MAHWADLQTPVVKDSFDPVYNFAIPKQVVRRAKMIEVVVYVKAMLSKKLLADGRLDLKASEH